MGRPPSDIAPRILHAARRRFLAEGVEGASLRAIARGARTSIGMIYYYFPTKDDLFLGVVEEVYVALLADLETALARTLPVEDRVRGLYRRLGALSVDETEVVRLVIREVLVSPHRLDRLVKRFQRGHLPLLAQLAEDGVKAGAFRKDLSPAVLLAAIGCLGGPAQAVLSVISERLPTAAPLPAPEHRSAALVDVLLSGIAAQPAARKT